jgi:hypothetical protein
MKTEEEPLVMMNGYFRDEISLINTGLEPYYRPEVWDVVIRPKELKKQEFEKPKMAHHEFMHDEIPEDFVSDKISRNLFNLLIEIPLAFENIYLHYNSISTDTCTCSDWGFCN